jgi:ABC-type antimicrobial peptide transport system permease subunit
VFEHITATWPMLWNITGDGEGQMYHGFYMTSGISRLLGVNPMIGRDFLPGEERKGGDAVVVLYYKLWRNRYAADPRIIGKKILFNEYPYTVVGVMPPGFRFPNRESQVLLPMGLDPGKPGSRSAGFVRVSQVWARLKPGVTIKQAEAEMNVIAHRLAEQYPNTNKGWAVTVTPARESTAGPIRPSLLLLLAAVGFVLLVACANVTNLMLARAAVRKKEIGVCSALGAARRHIFSRMLAESVVRGSPKNC